jgi:glycosyltransferase involved in cell wall biosynthesis
MDRPNYELAWHLADRMDASVYLVSHFVAPPLAEHPNVVWHRVPKPLGRVGLAEPLLSLRGRRTAKQLASHDACVVANGGNYVTPNVNWVHAVHAAWNNRNRHAPLGVRLRSAMAKALARRSERRAVCSANIVLTNSRRARQQIIDKLGVPAEQVHTVYYGIDPDAFVPVSREQKLAARKRLVWDADRPVVAFIGALGHDRNKGFDVLFDAWTSLCRDPLWDVDLVGAGAGAEVDYWRNRAQACGLQSRIRLLGFTRQIADVLAAADALVSPTHYEAYGQGVHEAICCGLPAFVTRTAGVAERFPEDLAELLLHDPPRPDDIVHRLRRWRRNESEYQNRVRRFADELRQRTWADMAAEIIGLVNTHSQDQQRKAA